MIFQLHRINNESTGDSSRTSASGNRLDFFAGGVKTFSPPLPLAEALRFFHEEIDKTYSERRRSSQQRVIEVISRRGTFTPPS